jgi:cyclopropane-fatty-acyl-phospholipid synthase
MNSCICTGTVTHTRLEPLRHRFAYPACFFCLDLAELPELGRLAPVFGYNSAGLAAIHDTDYFGQGKGSVREKLRAFLEAQGGPAGVQRVELVTVARCLNYACNPVNFYCCYGSDGGLGCAVAEINNTYGETHRYLLDRPAAAGPNGQAAFRTSKAFFVSPFFDLRGEYVFRFARQGMAVRIGVELWRGGRLALSACLSGQGAPLTRGSILRTLARYPLSAALTMPRIVWQALCLRRKGLRPLLKPEPVSPLTTRSLHTLRHRPRRARRIPEPAC